MIKAIKNIVNAGEKNEVAKASREIANAKRYKIFTLVLLALNIKVNAIIHWMIANKIFPPILMSCSVKLSYSFPL